MSATKIRGSEQIIAGSVTSTEVDSSVIVAGGGNPFTGDQSMGSHKLTSLTDPTNPQDAATKAYVDAAAQGLDIKASCRASTTANITLSGAQTIDGVSVIAGDRVLVKSQTLGKDNGIYVCATGAWSRATDADTAAKLTTGAFTFIEEGSTLAGSGWVLTTPEPITIGTTALTFAQFSGGGTYSAGNGLTLTGSSFSVVANDGIAVSGSGVAANIDTATGLKFDASTPKKIQIGLDGTSLQQSSSGLKVNPAKFITRETPSGSINSSNTTFTLANTPISGSEQVFLNGVLQEPGAGNDYTISGGTITYLAAPITGDRLRVSYMIA